MHSLPIATAYRPKARRVVRQQPEKLTRMQVFIALMTSLSGLLTALAGLLNAIHQFM